MTRFVTGRGLSQQGVLVFSPYEPLTDAGLRADLVDDFERCARAFGGGRIFGGLFDGRLCMRARAGTGADGPLFGVTPVLRDGRTLHTVVPGGRITRELVADFVRCDLPYRDRDSTWGLRPTSVRETDDGGVVARFEFPAPIMDPVRDAYQAPDPGPTRTIAIRFPDPWQQFFRPWEHLDGLIGRGDPNAAWMGRRRISVRAASSRLWWEVRGIHDHRDADRYRGMWADPTPFTAYLGWPAYLLDCAGPLHPCAQCGTPTVSARQYCGGAACNRRRGTIRQRQSRATGPG